MTRRTHFLLAVALVAQLTAASGFAQSLSASTYQGRLRDESGPIDGAATLQFRLYDSPTGGTLLAGPITVPDVTVIDGLFTTDLDFGSFFADTGKTGWLEITVATTGDPVTLSPRQRLAPAPVAIGLTSQSRIDVANTSNVAGPRISGLGGPVTAYVTFQAQSSGTLAGVVFRANFPFTYTPTFFGSVRSGEGVGGEVLAEFAQEIAISPTDREFTIDLSGLDVQVVGGAFYTVTILCGVEFATTSESEATVTGVSSQGEPAYWWFKSLMKAPTEAFVTQAQLADEAKLARTALSASSAQSAQYANEAFEARVLNAQFVSSMNNWELRLSAINNQNSGLGHFDVTRPFGNINFVPNGPVLFGDNGGGLGTRQNGLGNVALSWNRDGDIFTGRNVTVGQDIDVLQNVGVSGSVGVVNSLTVGSRVGIGTSVSSAGYRLELPNTASPAGQGRANAWVTYSSRKFKDQIETFPDPLATLNKLRGVTFVWNTPLEDGTLKHDIGFIAEEVAEAAPELVTCTPEGDATGLDYGKVVPITVEAIKAQQREIEQLRLDNAALLKRLQQLEHSLVPQK